MSMFLDESSLKILISSFVFSRIDYCNSLLCNVPNVLLDKLQRFQNQAARLVLRKNRREHITPMFLRLHWLPVNFRIRYKIALLCFKCIIEEAPSYLTELTAIYTPPRRLRSRDQLLLCETKKGSKRFGQRAFSNFAPSIWNSLPLSLRLETSESVFKKKLKTYFMRMFLDDD